ncbi:hypothetical protein AMJ80_05475 [bacterium SM23_31]|nr:MAG: hypothetical protein AMJ80_05475 [bacterium SM23_31]
MKRLSTVEEYNDLRRIILDEAKEEKPCIVISAGTCGQASGANDIIRIAKRYILENGLHEKISLRITGCHGLCEVEPFIMVEPAKNLYPKIKMKDVPKIIEAVIKNKVIEDLLYKEVGHNGEKPCLSILDIPYFKNQTRTILSKNESVDPIRIYDYIRHDGYSGLVKILNNPTKYGFEWIIKEVKKSGLRGRGGAGFPTGNKWEIARASGNGAAQKFIVCNADEGDPGAYMDRSLLEGNPHSIIEGLIIGGIAIGATKGVIYVRCEYPLAIKHTVIALRQARELGLLGDNILGTGISFDIEIVRGAGAFVCGEETALIKSIEGRMGEPRQRPPFPTKKGIWGYPTCINNVETLANIPVIISIGAKEFAEVGVSGNTGTKIFSLVGKIRNTGLVEVPMGIPIKEITYDIGGGSIGKAKIKAVQTGGPSGGCIPASMFDLPIDYDSLSKAGSIMGSGGMIVMDENTCMVDIAKYYMNFLKDESCGKCYTCRKGTQRMYEILEDITNGKGTFEQLDLLEELAEVVKDTTMCGLGQTAPNPVLSTLKYFRDEFIEHIKYKRCPAGVCKELIGAPCQSACPLGTEAWAYIAHIKHGDYEAAYGVIRKANPFPSVCARVCTHPCEDRCRAGTGGGQSIAIRALKRFVTDHVDPAIYKPLKVVKTGRDAPKVAVIGAGPAGLSAAHYLSLRGYKVTIFESENKPGGMLISGIPPYRLPRDVLEKEIESIIDENVTLKCNTPLGKDFNIDDLFNKKGFKAVFLAMGAHISQKLNIENEDTEHVYTSMEFLKSFHLNDKNLARGRVGVIGGGNSAIDSARVALRQKDVESVTIFYRRTRQEMPAFEEEIDATIDEKIKIELLVSPVKIHTKNGSLSGVEFIKNRLGEVDASGRRRPVPIPKSEYIAALDTLIVAIGEQPSISDVSTFGLEFADGRKIKIEKETLETNKPGIFAGGDVVTGPNTVVDAIAHGKKAAVMIDRYLSDIDLYQPISPQLPQEYIEPVEVEEELGKETRVAQPTVPVDSRIQNFKEVEMCFSVEEATKEAGRCLRCDLEFTQLKQDKKDEKESLAAGGKE